MRTLVSTGRHSVSVIIDERVRAELASTTRFHDIRLLETTDSTNRVVAELARAGVPEGVVVCADEQTAGRGRLDRSWESERGSGLLVSLLLRPQDLPVASWHLVTAAVALAARDACRDVAGVEPDIKWPNDLLVGGGKLAGILAEVTAGALVVGMGLNVHAGPPGSAVLDHAAGRAVTRGTLLVTWLRALDEYLRDWGRVSADYRAGCRTVGSAVLVDHVDGSRSAGRAVDIDDAGRLVVRGDDGGLVTVTVGDVTHVR